MNTNDPQAGYVAEQREPPEALAITILRAIETYKIEGECGVKYPVPLWRDIMAIINAKITSGELIVVKTATLIPGKYGGVECSQCGRDYPNPGVDPNSLNVGEFCRCGARIIE